MKKLVYLSDLSHVNSEGLVSEFIPYGIGCLKSYFSSHARSKDDVEIVLFKEPLLLRDAFFKKYPDVVAFSNYIWNSDLSVTFAREMKRLCPELVVVFGGPDFPLGVRPRTEWLGRNSCVDFYIVGEAEKTFTDLLDAFFEGRGLGQIKSSPIEGCHSLVQGALVRSDDAFPRMLDLDLVPSPYVQGYLDEFLDNGPFIPLTTTNRGCPYSCTYCDKGTVYWTRLSHRSIELIDEELEYIAKRSKSSVLCLADNNFGILPQDLHVAETLAKLRDRYNFPGYVSTATSKSKTAIKRVLECARILRGAMAVTAAVQTLDAEVASNIKRSNFRADELIHIARSSCSVDSSSRTEVILGLPGDTVEKHIATVSHLIDAGMGFLLIYTLILLQGSELSSKVSRDRWNLKTMFRLNHRCFGVYPFGADLVHSAEIEEVVVGSDSLTLEDYLYCRSYDLTVTIFYSDNILWELLAFINRFGIKSSSFIREIHFNGHPLFSDELVRLYQSFNEATRHELWENRDELASYLKSVNTIEDDEKVVGYNILFRHRAIALIDLTEDIMEVAHKIASRMLDDLGLEEYTDVLAQLKRYMCLRKSNIFEYEQVNKDRFWYDFRLLGNNDFPWPPARLTEPLQMTFFHSEEQKRLFRAFKPGLAGAMRILPRLAMAKMYRNVEISAEQD